MANKQDVLRELARRELESRGESIEESNPLEKESFFNVPKSKRGGALEGTMQLQQSLDIPPVSDAEIFSGLGAAALGGLGELAQRAVSAIANPIDSIITKKDIKEAAKSSFRGITGEERGEFGDIPRRLLPEKISGISTDPLSSAIGFVTEAGAFSLPVKSTIRNVASQINNIVKRSKVVKDINKNNNFFLNQAKILDKSINELSDAIGGEFSGMSKKLETIKIIPKDANKVNQIINKSSKDVIDRVRLELGVEDMGTVRLNNARVVNELKKAINAKVKRSVRAGKQKASPEQRLFMRQASELDGIIKDNAGKDVADALNQLNSKFRDFRNKEIIIKRLIKDGSGNFKTSSLPGLFKEGAEGNLNIIKEFGENFSPESLDVLIGIDKFNKKLAAKRAVDGVINRALDTTVGVGTGFGIAGGLRALRGE